MKAIVVALLLGIAGPASAVTLAVPALDYSDTSGETAGGGEGRVALFADTLRAELAKSGEVEVVLPDCGDCSPAITPFAAMAEATRAAGSDLLLVGNVHKVSTLIGTIRVKVLDLSGDRVLCTRELSYRGDTDEAFERAARFGAKDVLANCLP